ncbi:MAG: hypothetical protein ABC536_04200 [Candidatus Methanosuratincola petrocarbonis]
MKASPALAYRLALNRVVQRNSRIGADLLILDEPTDGFSIRKTRRRLKKE